MNRHSKILVLFLALTFTLVLAGIADHHTDEMVTCPVSGKSFKKSEANVSYDFKGKTYFFCCEKCKEVFMKDPEKYTQKKCTKKEVYICPMHPDIRLDKPGKCPKCGMKLEKKMMAMKLKKKHMHVHMHKAEGKTCCAMMGLMSCKDIEMKIEKLEDGVAVKLTSKNPEVVTKIQEHTTKMKEMCAKKVKCCKKEAKKEEVKK